MQQEKKKFLKYLEGMVAGLRHVVFSLFRLKIQRCEHAKATKWFVKKHTLFSVFIHLLKNNIYYAFAFILQYRTVSNVGYRINAKLGLQNQC